MSGPRVAVIGAGRFGVEHIRAYRSIGVELVGVVDPDPARAARAAALAGTTAFQDLDAMLSSAAPDAVSIVVPADVRGDLLDRLADRGLAVLVEKPVAATPATAAATAARYADRPVMAGHLLRFAAPYAEARTALEHPVRRISTGRRRDSGHRIAYPGEDVVGLTLVHDLDVIGWFAGPRAWTVRATGERGDDGRWVTVRAELTAGELRAVAVAEWVGETADAADSLTVNDGTDREGVVRLSGDDAAAVYDAALHDELRHFLDCAAARRASDRLRLADAAAAVTLAAAVRESLERGGVDVVC